MTVGDLTSACEQSIVHTVVLKKKLEPRILSQEEEPYFYLDM
jgi:hypothetical protein